MTVPVARAHVRRNVRMAVALVVGQAVLCVVIGYIALGGLGTDPRATPRAVGPLAAPTTGATPQPSTNGRTPAPGQPVPPGGSDWPGTSAGAPPGTPVLPATMAPPPASTAGLLPVLAAPPPGALPAGTTMPSPLEATSPTTVESTTVPATTTSDPGVTATQNSRLQPIAVLGDPCPRAGATGVTSDGVDVVCLPDADADLIWQLPKSSPSPTR